MEDFPKNPLFIDASSLIYFLKISRFDLLEVFNKPLVSTDFVRVEVKRPCEELETLLACKRIVEIPLTNPYELLEVEQLYGKGLGRGEASSIVIAHKGGFELVIDDKKARKLALERNVELHSSADVVIQNIRMGHLTLAEADSFITTWRSLGEFPVSCKSFKELIP